MSIPIDFEISFLLYYDNFPDELHVRIADIKTL